MKKKIIIDNLLNDYESLQWSWDEETDQAICLFSTEKQKAAITPLLSDIIGITVNDTNEITISSLMQFLSAGNYTLKEITTESKPSSSPRITFFTIPKLNLSEQSFLQRKPSPRFSPNRTLLKQGKIPKGLEIEAIINREATPTLWSHTLAYEEYFQLKTDQDNHKRQYRSIKSQSSLSVEHQYSINERLYPIKNAMIKRIRYFFDELLAPAYSELTTEEISNDLRYYFQRAIENLMLFRLDETLDKKALKKDFQNCLAPFLFFQESASVCLPDTMNKDTQKLLNQLKEKLAGSQALQTSINQLTTLKISSHTLRAELINEKKLFESGLKTNKVQGDFFSFYELLKKIAGKKINTKTLRKLFGNILLKISSFSCLEALRPEVAVIRTCDEDFFISRQLYFAITVTFKDSIHNDCLNTLDTPEAQTQFVHTVMNTVKLCIDKNISEQSQSFINLLEHFFKRYNRKIEQEQIYEIICDYFEKKPSVSGLFSAMKGDKDIYFETGLSNKINAKLDASEPLNHQAKQDADLCFEALPITSNDFSVIKKIIVELLHEATSEWANEKKQPQIDELCATESSSSNSSSSSSMSPSQ